MAVYITGDTHGYIDIDKLSYRRWPESRCLTDNDYLIICGEHCAPLEVHRVHLRGAHRAPVHVMHR